MNDFRFANLSWIHASWIVLLVAALLVVFELRGRSALDALLSRLMQQRLVHRTSAIRRFATICLATLSMLLLIAALMRPQWGYAVQQDIRVDSQIMVCIDVSKSMLAEDVAPNRLERAKVELDSLLGLMRDGQQVGLIAFAGRAVVLCPMTTDFGFLRLVLDEVQPQSVGLGGTKIGAAIDKAVDGFREAGDINRMILLITDGEDHESFPLDAARKAKDSGVRIVTVGFGDEAGSKIEITDPRTGVRSFVKDRNGSDVVSRLDGDTLRDIALETDGAYVPAGTGALDLESIYRKHIETMLTGSLDAEQRVVRSEAFQWFLLAAIICFFLSLACMAPSNMRTRALFAAQHTAVGRTNAAAGSTLLMALVVSLSHASAQPPDDPPAIRSGRANTPSVTTHGKQTREGDNTPAASSTEAGTTPDTAAETSGQSTASEQEQVDESLPPRTIYNQALAYIESNPKRAERYLNHARSNAGSDGELRFRALYNLGWVEVHRADALLEEDPEGALQHLHQAANRFREAIRVRPDNTEARQNLEIVSRRILELTDALRKKETRDLATRLDELIVQTRTHQGALQQIVQQVSDQEPGRIDTYRSEFRTLAVTERQLIADSERLLDDARAELDALKGKADDQKSTEDRVRTVQLENMLGYLESGIQRLNRARSLTRRLQGAGAFRRWSSALNDLKRARDQLRHPVEVLAQVLADATEMAGQAELLATPKLSLEAEQPAGSVPAWVTKDYIVDLLSSTVERTAELEQVFDSVVSSQTEDASATDAANEPRMQWLVSNMKAAIPLLQEAQQQFDASLGALDADEFRAAYESQVEAIIQLSKAQELFLDIRRLIEVMYRQQQLAKDLLQQTADDDAATAELTLAIDQIEGQNLQRATRLATLLELERSQLPAPAPPNDDSNDTSSDQPNQDETQQQRQRLQLADELLADAEEAMERARNQLKEFTLRPDGPEPPAATSNAVENMDAQDDTRSAGEPDDAVRAPEQEVVDPTTANTTQEPQTEETPLGAAREAMDQSIVALEELRRLFFSLVEHLRDTAVRQTDVNDRTAQLAAADETPTSEKTGPLAVRQQQLGELASEISKALQQQSEEAAAAADQQASAAPNSKGPDPQDTAAAAQKLTQAATLVDAAQQSMSTAAEKLFGISQDQQQPDSPFTQVQESQVVALEKLLEALALLDEQNNRRDQQQNQQDQQNQSQDQQQQQQQQQMQLNANQLLQLIRDREAERRKQKNHRARSTGAAVDKDW